MTKKVRVIIAFLIVTSFAIVSLNAAAVGQKLKQVELMKLKKVEGKKKKKWGKGNIPFIGKKVLTIMYTDVDVADMNDPLSDAIKKKNYSSAKYQGIGIGNSKDAPWKPDVFIRMAVKRKLKRYPGSVILLDEDRSFSKKLNLGDCNQKAVVMVVNKQGIIKYLKKISSQEESKAMIPEVLALMNKLLK